MLSPDEEARIESLLAAMTIDEKIGLTAGADAWRTHGVPRAGVPAVKVSDGPNGARGDGNSGATSAAFPVGTLLGATWDRALLRRVGEAIAEETLTKGAGVLLGPTVNIHRHQLAGRNFECYSEDPLLTAELAVQFVEGLQSKGVAATMKHFVANDSEYQRNTISSEVGERALHEIYLLPFEAAIKRAHAWAVMTSYNRINGTYACDHDELVHGLLKGEWGFDGLVMSDWFGTQSTVEAANAGLDLEMPGRGHYFGKRLGAAVDSGDVSYEVVDDKTRRLLRLAMRTGAFNGLAEQAETSVDRPEHRALIREAAAAGMVLLVNRDAALPLDAKALGSLAVIGPNASPMTIMGGGSSQVTPHHVSQPLEAIAARVAPGTKVAYEQGCRTHRVTPLLREGITADGVHIAFYNNPDFAGEPVLTRDAHSLQHRWLAGGAPPEVSEQYSARATATYRAQHTGAHRFTLVSAGLSRMWVDGTLVVENWEQWQPGSAYYGNGSAEAGGTVDLAAGSEHAIVVEFQAPFRGIFSAFQAGCATPEPADLFERAVAAAKDAEAAVVFVGLNADWEKEGEDRVDMRLPGRQDELVSAVAAVNSRTVVVVNAGSPVEMPWAQDVAAVLYAWYPGQEAGDAVADVLFGESEPGGRLPTSFPVRVEDNPADLTYPGEAGTVSYGEGVFVGYRGFRRRGAAPAFPFGFGLSYTTFEVGAPRVESQQFDPGEPVTVRVPVANTGPRAGSTVVQVYVRDVESTLLRPDRELKGFQKVHLAAGEEQVVEIALDGDAFAAWDPRVHERVVEPGEFVILAGTSVEEITGEVTITVGQPSASGEAARGPAILA